MSAGFWLSVVLGGGIGVLYAVAAYLIQRKAVKVSGARFMRLIVGGMLGRMLMLLVLVATVLALKLVEIGPFAIVLAVTLLLGLGLDVWWMMRHMKAVRASTPPSTTDEVVSESP